MQARACLIQLIAVCEFEMLSAHAAVSTSQFVALLMSAHSLKHTPLQACANGNTECAAILLEAGAAVVGNDSGNTPLHWAVLNKHIDVVRVIALHRIACVPSSHAVQSGTNLTRIQHSLLLALLLAYQDAKYPYYSGIRLTHHGIHVIFRFVCCAPPRQISTCLPPTGSGRVLCRTHTDLVRRALR